METVKDINHADNDGNVSLTFIDFVKNTIKKLLCLTFIDFPSLVTTTLYKFDFH